MIKRLKMIKFKDILSIFIFIIILPISLIYRLFLKIRKKDLWLICEDKNTARDNGYHFFKYMRTNHKDINCYYAIDKKSKAYDNVKEYGNIINYGSLKHWIFYLSSKYNISNQKSGNPSPAFFYFLHVKLGLFKNRVFLQHGITNDDSPWLYYKNTKFKFFICGAKREYEYIKDKFGYPNKNVIYTGFARFDNLHDNKTIDKQILIMPTWRNWLNNYDYTTNDESFKKTSFYINWNNLLNNKEFISFIEKNNIKVLFYPHRNIQKYLHLFKSNCKNIEFLDCDYNIQKALKESNLLITDYSSVYMDFAYMKKMTIYFQFDYEEYREKQLQTGYYDYKRDSFGPVLSNDNDTVKEIIEFYKNGINKEYLNRMNSFFEKCDSNNCKRIYNCLK